MHLSWPHEAWAEIQWGTVPAWLSGILSGASVLLALYIILRDREKAEREQITKLVVINRRRSVKREGTSHEIVMINASDQPFYDLGCGVVVHPRDQNKPRTRRMPAPRADQRLKRWRYMRRLKQMVAAAHGYSDGWSIKFEDENEEWQLEPGKRATCSLDLSAYGRGNPRIIVRSTDASGRYWFIDPVTKAVLPGERFVGGITDWG